ncbi:hypothetical protein ACFL6C_00205 [Myxococcota bacterium]
MAEDLVSKGLELFASGDLGGAARLWLRARAQGDDDPQVDAYLEHIAAIAPDVWAATKAEVAALSEPAPSEPTSIEPATLSEAEPEVAPLEPVAAPEPAPPEPPVEEPPFHPASPAPAPSESVAIEPAPPSEAEPEVAALEPPAFHPASPAPSESVAIEPAPSVAPAVAAEPASMPEEVEPLARVALRPERPSALGEPRRSLAQPAAERPLPESAAIEPIPAVLPDSVIAELIPPTEVTFEPIGVEVAGAEPAEVEPDVGAAAPTPEAAESPEEQVGLEIEGLGLFAAPVPSEAAQEVALERGPPRSIGGEEIGEATLDAAVGPPRPPSTEEPAEDSVSPPVLEEHSVSSFPQTVISDAHSDPWGGGRGVSIEVSGFSGGLDLAAAPATAEPISLPPAELVRGEVKLKDLLDLDDFTGALEAADALLEMDAEHVFALAARKKCRETLQRMYESKIGALTTVPSVKMPPEQVIWLDLDHRSGFILAQVDGVSTYDELVELTGMDRLEALRIMAQLVAKGVIGV